MSGLLAVLLMMPAMAGAQDLDGERARQLLVQLGSTDFQESQKARAALIAMGEHAVPALVEELDGLDGPNPVATAVVGVLAAMGAAAEEALPFFAELCETEGDDPWPEQLRVQFLVRATDLEWAIEDLLPLVEDLIHDPDRPEQTRKCGVHALAAMGEEAIESLRAAGDELPFLQLDAYRKLAELHDQRGSKEPVEFWQEVILANPLSPTVRELLPQAAQMSGARHLTTVTRVKAALQRELQREPSAETAMQLALIIQDQLRGCDLNWESPGDGGPVRSDRLDVSADYRVMAERVAQAFDLAEAGSARWREIGVGLAKIHLLLGDWDAMDGVLEELGTPRPELEDLSEFSIPPKDWSDASSTWTRCDEAMRNGTSVVHFRVECQGRGVQGAQILLREAPPPPGPNRVWRSGWRVDTLTHGPQPFSDVHDFGGSFGYIGGDRAGTRYGTTDEEGNLCFAHLPARRLRVQVLVPAGSIEARARDWEMSLVLADGSEHSCGAIGVAGEDPQKPQLLHPAEGEVVRYPTIRLRPSFSWNVEPWDAIEPEDFVLRWPKIEGEDVRYEVELKLSCPEADIMDVAWAKVLARASVETSDCQWPLGEVGVGSLRLVPGNVYLLAVTARDGAGKELARFGDTIVWVPWERRESKRPWAQREPHSSSSYEAPPLSERSWWLGSNSYGDGREETFKDKVSRHIRDHSENFEWEYLRVLDAWLTWGDGDFARARILLEELAGELPVASVPRITAEWLMAQMDAGKKFERALHLKGSVD